MNRQNPLRNQLNRMKWDSTYRDSNMDIHVTYRDPLVMGGYGILPFGHVEEICAKGIETLGDDFIPYHRITEVTLGNEVLYSNPIAKRN